MTQGRRIFWHTTLRALNPAPRVEPVKWMLIFGGAIGTLLWLLGRS